MRKREFVLRILIGLGCILVFTLLVFWRQHVVRTQRGQAIVSTIAEWEQHGKPVVVQNMAYRDMKVYAKITITPLSKTLFEGYVTKDIQERLRVGQSVYVNREQGERFFGVISYVGQELNVDTGMFRVRVAFDHEVTLGNHIVIGHVHTSTMKDVISIPDEIIADSKGKFFVWTVHDSRAYKQNVILGERNGYSAVVVQGLLDGDMVVLQGQTQLMDGDKVRILDYDQDM